MIFMEKKLKRTCKVKTTLPPLSLKALKWFVCKLSFWQVWNSSCFFWVNLRVNKAWYNNVYSLFFQKRTCKQETRLKPLWLTGFRLKTEKTGFWSSLRQFSTGKTEVGFEVWEELEQGIALRAIWNILDSFFETLTALLRTFRCW